MFLKKVHLLKPLAITVIIKMNPVNQNVNNALPVGHSGRKVKPVVMHVEMDGINQIKVKDGVLKLAQDITQEMLLNLQEPLALLENINQAPTLQVAIHVQRVNIKIKQVNQAVKLALTAGGQMQEVLLVL